MRDTAGVLTSTRRRARSREPFSYARADEEQESCETHSSDTECLRRLVGRDEQLYLEQPCRTAERMDAATERQPALCGTASRKRPNHGTFQSGVILASAESRPSFRQSVLVPLLVRTLVSLMTALSMVHLTLIGGDLACASHLAAGPGMPEMAMMGTSPGAFLAMTMDTSAASGEHGSARPPKDCATPSNARCCEAMASCGVTAKLSVAERFAPQSRPFAGTPALPTADLESVLVAPEPPPPKA